jgi:hypothetical protein
MTKIFPLMSMDRPRNTLFCEETFDFFDCVVG